jgi:hypothetical protein
MRRREITGSAKDGKRRIPRWPGRADFSSGPHYPALTSNFADLTTNSEAILIF